jgi:hypothetical protein
LGRQMMVGFFDVVVPRDTDPVRLVRPIGGGLAENHVVLRPAASGTRDLNSSIIFVLNAGMSSGFRPVTMSPSTTTSRFRRRKCRVQHRRRAQPVATSEQGFRLGVNFGDHLDRDGVLETVRNRRKRGLRNSENLSGLRPGKGGVRVLKRPRRTRPVLHPEVLLQRRIVHRIGERGPGGNASSTPSGVEISACQETRKMTKRTKSPNTGVFRNIAASDR